MEAAVFWARGVSAHFRQNFHQSGFGIWSKYRMSMLLKAKTLNPSSSTFAAKKVLALGNF